MMRPRRVVRRRWPWGLAAGLIALTGMAAHQEQQGWPGLAPWLVGRVAVAQGLQLSPDTRLHLLVQPRLLAPWLSLQRGGLTLAQAQDLELAWRWRDLWRWQREGAALRLRRVHAERLDLDWRRDAAGHSPWQTPSAEPVQAAPLALPVIEELRLTQGEVQLDDTPLRLQGRARFGSDDTQRWHAELSGRLNGQALQLQAQASAPLALLKPAGAGAEPAAVSLSLSGAGGQVSFQGEAASLLDARALSGRVQVSGSSLQAVGRPLGVTLPATAPFRLAGRLQHDGGLWRLDELQARVGASRLDGQFVFDLRGARPQLRGQLGGGPLKLADLGPAVGADQRPGRPGRVLPDRPMDLPALGAMDAQVAVRLSQLDFGSAALAPLAPVQAELNLERGRLALNGLQLGTESARLAGDMVLDSRMDPPQWQVDLSVQDLPLERWVRGLQRREPRAGEPAAWLSGRLRAQVQVHGQGRSTAQLLGSLDGRVQAQLVQGRVSHLAMEAAGLDAAQALGVWLRGDDGLALDCARFDGRFTRGVLRPRVAVVDNADSRLLLSGQLDLNREQLDLRVTARPKDFSPLALRAPIEVVGPLAAPRVGLQASALGGRALAAAALALVAPPAALLALVDTGSTLPPLSCGGA
ncbi:MAG: hypothetical protein DI603_12460 [Roseateles depolymerans]|uniref:AsmA domain-containing protein n=1 Tax=Roseateles depolymerans TaxID=76731 RepID=A0A2W5DIF7_9BURK|nr:MAG: hypothetical protein DI603_12460 [Roseateles depolymerans]